MPLTDSDCDTLKKLVACANAYDATLLDPIERQRLLAETSEAAAFLYVPAADEGICMKIPRTTNNIITNTRGKKTIYKN